MCVCDVSVCVMCGVSVVCVYVCGVCDVYVVCVCGVSVCVMCGVSVVCVHGVWRVWCDVVCVYVGGIC